MRIIFISLITLSAFMDISAQAVAKPESVGPPFANANVQPQATPTQAITKEETQKAPVFTPYTGKITRNKVRLRAQPGYEGTVLREYNKGDMVVVLGESDDFFAIKPPKDFKGYVFRTFIIDNIVEGNRVNVRLYPDTDSPVVAQLNSGDRAQGTVSANNNKWLEISLPTQSRFYISKDYVEKIGDADFMARQEKRKEDVFRLLNTTETVAHIEMQKPFEQINLDGIKANYQHIIMDYPDFPEAGKKAKELTLALKEAYTVKNVAYLETHAHRTTATLEDKNRSLVNELESYKDKVVALETQLQTIPPQQSNTHITLESRKPSTMPINMTAWIPIEDALFQTWAVQTGKSNPGLFYEEQKKTAFLLNGIVDNYNRPIKNRPGDFLLLSSTNKMPVAFLYSTTVNLQELVGHQVTLHVIPRPNNNFAFPAYFVFSVE